MFYEHGSPYCKKIFYSLTLSLVLNGLRQADQFGKYFLFHLSLYGQWGDYINVIK